MAMAAMKWQDTVRLGADGKCSVYWRLPGPQAVKHAGRFAVTASATLPLTHVEFFCAVLATTRHQQSLGTGACNSVTCGLEYISSRAHVSCGRAMRHGACRMKPNLRKVHRLHFG